MANKLQQTIEELRAQAEEKTEFNSLLTALEAKQAELGEDASEAEVEQALAECLEEQIRSLMGQLTGQLEGDGEIIVDEAYMASAKEKAEAFFAEENLKYTSKMLRADVALYELPFKMKECRVIMKVMVADNPRVCRIDAVFPFTADKKYDYLLCKAIAKENYSRRLGAFQYDERDGEVSYRYTFSIQHGLHQDDLKQAFFSVVSSAVSSYDTIKNCCVGKFKQKEIAEILNEINVLVNDLRD